MNLEIEATFLEIDKSALREQLKSFGARLVHPEILMRRTNFDTGPRSFTRVRDEGDKIVLTYKIHHDNSLTGTEEYNVEVSNYTDTIEILKRSGLRPKAVQETYREEWDLDGVKIDIDTWPWLPTFVEIEGETPDAVRATAKKLGFNMKSAIISSVDEVYCHYYDITCEELNSLPEITFTSIPDFFLEHLREVPLAPASIRHEKSCGAIIIENSKALLVHQENGFWSFPKGHVEIGESELETALRETKEETNLDIVISPATRYTINYYVDRLNVDKEVILFLARLKTPADFNKIKNQPGEIAESRWVPLAEVESVLERPAWKELWHKIYSELK